MKFEQAAVNGKGNFDSLSRETRASFERFCVRE